MEIGGLKGRSLSARITAVSLEFNTCFTQFSAKTYDVLEPDDPSFKDDFVKFQERILELDLKLAAILCQAFDDCHNLESVFKVIDSAEALQCTVIIIRIHLAVDQHRGQCLGSAEDQGRVHKQVHGNLKDARRGDDHV